MIVYKAYVGDKVYVGATRCTLNKRIREHRYAFKAGYGTSLVGIASNFEDISFKVMHECSNLEEMYRLEVCEIAALRSLGYTVVNKSTGGKTNKGWTPADGARSKLRDNGLKCLDKYGVRHYSDMAKKAWADPNTRQGLIEAKFGKVRSKETKAKTSTALNRHFDKVKKIVEFLDRGTSTVVFEHNRLEKLSEFLGVNRTSICRYLSGTRNNNKYILRYKGDTHGSQRR